MARWLIAVVTAVLVSCGGSSGPTYDGGINGTPPTGNSGFVFTPADGAGVPFGPVGCTIQGQPLQFSGLLIAFSSDTAGVCDFARSHGIQCVDIANASSTFVGIQIVKGALSGVTRVGARTYTMNLQETFPPDLPNEIILAGATMTDIGPACVPNVGTPLVDGTVTITSASAARVTGSVDLTWTGGGFSGPFDVVGCTVGVDVCALANGNIPVCSGCF